MLRGHTASPCLGRPEPFPRTYSLSLPSGLGGDPGLGKGNEDGPEHGPGESAPQWAATGQEWSDVAHLELLTTNRWPESGWGPVGLAPERKRSSRRVFKEGLGAVPESHAMHSGII